MNKILKRLLSFTLLFLFVFISVNVNAASEITEIGGAKYFVDSTKATNDLPYGVKQWTDLGQSSATLVTGDAAGLGGGGRAVPGQLYKQQVNVLEVPATSEAKITPWTKQSSSRWNKATVKQMAADYESRNPGYRVVAAINGDFFDINGNNNFQFTPTGVHVSGGEFYKTKGNNVIGFKNDGSVNSLVGNIGAATRTAKIKLAIYDANGTVVNTFDIDKVNAAPAEGEVAIYYAVWNDSSKIVPTEVTDTSAFVVTQAEFALPIAENSDFYGKGTITSIGASALNEGDFAIVSKNANVTATLGVGVKIRAQREFTGAWADVKDAVGVGQTILADGTLQGSDTARHPRTMVGIKADGTIVMTVVDGRQPTKDMYGATQTEMAAILQHYGAVDAYNLDGGGSSTMIILKNGEFEVLNSPSDGIERSDSNCLLVVVKVPTINYTINEVTPNSFKVDVDLVNKNGHEFDDLYVKVNETIKKVENGQVVFDNLQSNTGYGFEFLGGVGDQYSQLVISDRVTTSKRLPTLDKVNIILDDTDLIFNVSLTDLDGAISRKFIKIGDQSIPLSSKGQAIFYDFEGNMFDDLVLEYSYDLNDGTGRQDIVTSSFKMQCGLDIFMKAVSSALNEQMGKIYGASENAE